MIQSVRHKVYLLNKIRGYINQRTAIMIYKCKILPYLDYGDLIYNEMNKTQTKKLQSLQNRSIRISHKLTNRPNVDSIHINHKLLHLDNRRILHLLTYMHYLQSNSNLFDSRPISTRQHDGPSFEQPMPKSSWFNTEKTRRVN